MPERGKSRKRPRSSHGKDSHDPLSSTKRRWISSTVHLPRRQAGGPSSPSDSEPSAGSSDSSTSDEYPERQPHQTIDWRRELCTMLELAPDVPDSRLFGAIKHASVILREAETQQDNSFQKEEIPKREIIYKVACHDTKSEAFYLDEPWIVETGRYNVHLTGSHAIPHLELHLERHKVAFVVYRNFECCGAPPANYDPQGHRMYSLDSILPSLSRGENIAIVTEELAEGLQQMADGALQGIPHPKFNRRSDDKILYPYLWWFHRREQIGSIMEQLDQVSHRQVDALKDYIESRLAQEWNAVDPLLAEGKIKAKYIQYAFVPETILIFTSEGKETHQLNGLLATDWLHVNNSSSETVSAAIDVAFWDFQGAFYRTIRRLDIKIPEEIEEDGTFAIQNLSIYPMKYAALSVIVSLRRRGAMFWECRYRNYVSWCRPEYSGKVSLGTRCMIDAAMYGQMHPERQRKMSGDKMAPEIMGDDPNELGDETIMCLPIKLPGFDMEKKEWVDLEVDFMTAVTWNSRAFDLLVLDAQTKELIQAVVSNKLKSEENTDIVHGKGNGLYVLLHGPPGTGKTLTAESVAEVAQKPLYRITGGDMGIRAEDIERNLERVLTLGTAWDCVVLLDEADIFLEKRTTESLKRNALISVFLRILEYYNGILFLTSNRVESFDEAFRSRIQIVIRYDTLSKRSRLQIWKNFLKLLEAKAHRGRALDHEPPYPIDLEDVQMKIHELAEEDMNGRQIRNAFSTALQLAAFRMKPVTSDDLMLAVRMTCYFNRQQRSTQSKPDLYENSE
ncbi:hypothetical protein K456DRAFT_1775146, partial [Colletotrichum gloeosporioides 23]